VVREAVITDEASEEVSVAYFWYEGQELGLGDRFLGALKHSIQAAAAQPDFFPLRFDEVRSITLQKFPYTVYFEHDDQFVYVLSVFHGSRDPSRLNRLKNL
jgi:plasmid stabilization system protein ParE